MTRDFPPGPPLPAALLLIAGGLLPLIGALGLGAAARLLRAHASAGDGLDARRGLRADRLDARVVGASRRAPSFTSC